MPEAEKKNKVDFWDWSKKDVESSLRNAFTRKAAGRWIQLFLIRSVSVVVLIFLGVVSWRIAWSNWNVDLSKFDFSDLLALIMGLFAVAMSVAFYFKATDTSNKFYDNLYKFTQETSEILGRIEAGFGERLRHLDEGYSGLQSRFDKFSPLTPEESKQKVEKNKEREEDAKTKLQETIEEKQKILDQLAERAKLQAKEKIELFDNLKKLEEKNNKAEMRLRKLQDERDRMQEEMHLIERNMLEEGRMIEPYLRNLLHDPEIRHLMMAKIPFEIIRKRFGKYLNMFPRQFASNLQEQGILSEDGELTRTGYTALRNIARRLRHNPEM